MLSPSSIFKIEDALFWSKVDVKSIEDCWKWKGATDSAGYGKVKRRGFYPKDMVASRYSYYLLHGVMPTNYACHTCDNPICVNPHHLFDGTNKENQQDSIRKGRKIVAPQDGENNGNAKLTVENVLEIKQLLPTMNNTKIAKKYNVTHAAISAIRKGKSWNSV